MKKPFGLRLSEEGLALLAALAKKHGLSQASAVEMSIRHTASKYGIGMAVSAEAQQSSLDADLYGFHPWMRQIADYARNPDNDLTEGLGAEDVLQSVFDKSLRQQTIEDKRAVSGCLKRLGWVDRNKDGVWFPAGTEVKP